MGVECNTKSQVTKVWHLAEIDKYNKKCATKKYTQYPVDDTYNNWKEVLQVRTYEGLVYLYNILTKVCLTSQLIACKTLYFKEKKTGKQREEM